jgi:hypothetical protein
VGPDLCAIEHNAAFVVMLDLVDAADERGLAGTGRTAQHDALTPLHPQVDVVQGTEGAEVFIDTFHRDDDIVRHGQNTGSSGSGAFSHLRWIASSSPLFLIK